MQISDFTYDLPDKLIAQRPPKVRGTSRLLVLHRNNGQLEHKRYSNFVDYVQPGDVVVLNDTKVIKARLHATNTRSQPRELLLLEDHHNIDFSKRRCLYSRSLKVNEVLDVDGTPVTITAILGDGIAEISAPVNLLDLAEREGTVPLPPYMHREASKEDTQRYQTVFAKEPGSVAAPTASLNITKELLDSIVAKKTTLSYLTLHVGLGTFLPIRTDKIEEHDMHSEYFEIPRETVDAIQQTKAKGGRVWAVGTTVTRTLEYASQELMQQPKALTGEATIFIYPGYKFKVVDGLLTNFHAPKSTVLMLAAAFAGWDNLSNAYQQALKHKYAFLSYGDSMLIV